MSMWSKRKRAVQEKRAMIRVRYKDTRELTTIAVCPACWNIPARREILLIKVDKMGLEVTFRDDQLHGLYQTDKVHSPGCPHNSISSDPWKRFERAVKKRL